MPWYLTEALKQGPLVTVLVIVIAGFLSSKIVPGTQVTTVINQCSDARVELVKDRDQWRRLALRGRDILQERAQDLAEAAPDRNEASKRVVVKAKPIAPEVKKNIEQTSTATDATSVEQRIETSNRILESAPVQSAKPKTP